MEFVHAAIYVEDLEAARDFYAKYFGGRANKLYENPKTGLRTYFLDFGGGAKLEIMSRPEVKGGADAQPFRAGFAHIAFKADKAEQVDGLTAQIEADGFKVLSRPRITGDGYYESCVADPEGNAVEITA